MSDKAKNDSFIMGRLMKDLASGSLDQITAKAYLDKNVFGYLEKSLNDLLETIESNGEFEKYVTMLADRQEKEQRELRRRAREQRRIEMGDQYVSSGSEGSVDSDDNDVSDEDSFIDNGDVSGLSPNRTLSEFGKTGTETIGQMPEMEGTAEMGDHLKINDTQSNRKLSDAMSSGLHQQEIFNPLRFLG